MSRDYEEFMALRKHIRKLQQGTPLLMNSGHDELEICSFQISSDLQSLVWRACEGRGEQRQLPLRSIGGLQEISVPKNGSGEHYALKVRLKEEVANAPKSFELICTSKEDLDAWHEGLRFLMDQTEGQGRGGESREDDCEWLKQENAMLREMLKRKDATIAELLRDSKPIKTESTSKESDEHLQFREVAILRRKNKRLQNELKSKQHTISGLLKLVERLSAQQDETSAQETLEEPEVNPKKLVEIRPEVRREGASTEKLEEEASAEGFSGELAALADKLQMLERAAQAATEGVASVSTFQPPARTTQMAPKGPRSAKALEALQREVNVLEEKKRLVQHLAHTLEPEPSDSEDGFPLR